MSREAMQIALDALEANLGNWAAKTKAVKVLRQALETEQKTAVSPGKGTGFNYFRASAITVLRQAQEPVAWISDSPTKGNGKQLHWTKAEAWRWSSNITPLYTAPPKRDLTCVCGAVWEGETMVHPPREREWRGLTDEEIITHFQTNVDIGSLLSFVDGARYAEAKLKEKNHG